LTRAGINPSLLLRSFTRNYELLLRNNARFSLYWNAVKVKLNTLTIYEEDDMEKAAEFRADKMNVIKDYKKSVQM